MPHQTDERRITPGTELLTLRAENDRLKAYLSRVLAMLETRIDEPGRSTPALGSGPVLVAAPEPEDHPTDALDERLLLVMQDLERIETHVESLLWRLGEHRSSLAAGT